MGKTNKSSFEPFANNLPTTPRHSMMTIVDSSIKQKSISRKNRTRNEIPLNFDPTIVYKPRFCLQALISTSKKRHSIDKPPRSPNSFFLFKNCLLLELWELDLRPAMPTVCKLAKNLWKNAPQEAKELYDSLSTEALRIHHSMYPNYKFQPKRPEASKNNKYITNTAAGMTTTFSINPVYPIITVSSANESQQSVSNFDGGLSDVSYTSPITPSIPSPLSLPVNEQELDFNPIWLAPEAENSHHIYNNIAPTYNFDFTISENPEYNGIEFIQNPFTNDDQFFKFLEANFNSPSNSPFELFSDFENFQPFNNFVSVDELLN
ncbi:685_t:CDS:1 [Ambispora gerdemannii]|uniref:685_t:CDS:1 n=1 Tax=Ambispora gerdemannii TaxID=144530 RepID=A0A9N9AQF0_9GLOM|nr:685_t:CDS:1 [Ambispora gerdemannii]